MWGFVKAWITSPRLAGAISDIFSSSTLDVHYTNITKAQLSRFDNLLHSIDCNTPNHLKTRIHTISPCSGESQQQFPPRLAECSQPPPDPASPRPCAQQHPQSLLQADGSTTRKISRIFAQWW